MNFSKSPELFYKIHIFCCINEKETPVKSCGGSGSKNLQAYLKKRCQDLGLAKNTIRVNQSGCLGRCALGPVMVVYPEAIWYHYRDESDINEIIDQHLLKGNVVQRLLINNN